MVPTVGFKVYKDYGNYTYITLSYLQPLHGYRSCGLSLWFASPYCSIKLLLAKLPSLIPPGDFRDVGDVTFKGNATCESNGKPPTIATGRFDICCASVALAAFPAAVVARRRKAQLDSNAYWSSRR